MQEFFNQFPLLIDEIRRYPKSEMTVLLQTDSQQSQGRLQKLYRDIISIYQLVKLIIC